MPTFQPTQRVPSLVRAGSILLLLPMAFHASATARAQQQDPADLPEAPVAQQVDIQVSGGPGGVAPQIAPKYKSTIQPWQTAVPLSATDKLAYSFRQQSSPIAFASILFSAGYGHWTDTRPHFGTDKAGFGERLGNAALRRTAASVIGAGMIAPLLHEDPRYYRKGSDRAFGNFSHRAVYAASRIVITRNDHGGRTINAAQLLGIGFSQALVQTYYPTRDRGTERIFSSTASSWATSAGVYVVREFLPDITSRFRHRQSRTSGGGEDVQ